ncbi:MAG: alpha/beta fold hydrolase [Actinomycetota bacterium]|nr:alpha/beta fold hydrolase [Actinomycetota bacterium]
MASAPAHAPAPSDPDTYGPQTPSPWLEVDWREHLRWVTVRGRRANVMEIGEGPPLLLVHGHSGCWQNWLENVPHFARTHRVVAPDLPGFGYSDMPADGVSIEGYARFLDALCDELGIESTPVVGNSLGGFVGAELCLKFPERSSRLALVSAAGLADRYIGLPASVLRRKSVAGFARATNAYARLPDARLETLVRRPRLRRAVLRMVAAHPDRLPAPMCAELLRGSGRPAAPDATDALVTYDFRDRLGDVRCPTLIVWGDRDRTVPVQGAEEYERLIPNARKVIMRDTGHVPMVERPAQFNALLEEFLAEEGR